VEAQQVRVLVTGALGFIGRKLCSKLRQLSHDVVELDILPTSSADMGVAGYTAGAISADIRDVSVMRKVAEIVGQADACVHLAAIAAPRKAEAEPQLAWETNVRGTHNVLELCRRVGARKVVFTSSAHVYGISPLYMPTDERHPLALLDTYTTTKIMGEQLCELFHANHGLSYTICRLFNAYGPGQSPDYFMGKRLEEARAGRQLVLMNGDVTKDWVWVYDVVDALVACLGTAYVGPVNVGTGRETSLREIAALIAQSFGTFVVSSDAKDGGPTRMCASWERARSVLGWSPRVSFEEGLRLTMAAAAT
jgi:nucleoside-diphosphate-sugar epimerase